MLNQIIDEISEPDKSSNLNSGYYQTGKHIWSRNESSLGATIQGSKAATLMNGFNSPRLLQIIQRITGFDHLEIDPEDWGAGIQQTVRGGSLHVHTDMSRLQHGPKYRRANLIVYLNKDWKDEYGGELEFWNDGKVRKLAKKVPPIFNRSVIFETTGKSWHGHPKPLNTPDGITRKSVAFFFYSDKPGNQDRGDTETRWLNSDGSLRS